MTKERISKLSDHDLIKLAQVFSVDLEDDIDEEQVTLDAKLRADIEGQIFDVLEENRQERKDSDSHPVQQHQQRFQTIEDFFGYPLEDETSFFTFPDQYNITRTMLMLRDPDWAYCYWDISNQDRAKHTGQSSFRNFAILLKDAGPCSAEREAMTGPEPAGKFSRDDFEMRIPIQLRDNNWYINLPRRNRRYYVELVAEFEDHWMMMARSGEIRVPGGDFGQISAGNSTRQSDVLIALSRVEDLGVGGFEGTPRRLVELLDQDEQ